MNNKSGVTFALRHLSLLPEASQTTRKKAAASVVFPEVERMGSVSVKGASQPLSRLAKIGYQGGATYLSGGAIKFESGGDKVRFHWDDKTQDAAQEAIIAETEMPDIAFELPCRYVVDGKGEEGSFDPDDRFRPVDMAYQIKVYNFWGEWVRSRISSRRRMATASLHWASLWSSLTTLLPFAELQLRSDALRETPHTRRLPTTLGKGDSPAGDSSSMYQTPLPQRITSPLTKKKRTTRELPAAFRAR
jgi:hypothetical protein